MRYLLIIVIILPLSSSHSQYPQVELYQTTQDYYYYPVGTSYGFDYLGGHHLLEGRTNPGPPPIRKLFYNFVELNGDSIGWVRVTLNEGSERSESLHIFPGNKAAVTFTTYAGENNPMIAVDMLRGFGVFEIWPSPDEAVDTTLYGSFLTADRNNRFHMVYFQSGFPAFHLKYSSWTEPGDQLGPVVIDYAVLPDAKIVTKQSSDRVAIFFLKAIIEDNEEILGANVAYIVSEDGENWDFENDIVDVTDYDESNLRAYGNIDALFDDNDFLQIVWNETILDVGGHATLNGRLIHFNEQTGESNLVAVNIDDEWDAYPGNGNIGIGNMAIACNEIGHLYIVWEEFHNTDASNTGYCNGDIYLSYSFDGGRDWTRRENLTNSQTPGCIPGECESDIFPDLDERTEEEIRLFYLSDRDAGSWILGEGVSTVNSTYFMTVSPLVDVIGNVEIPDKAALLSAYPNPFNAKTTIKFSLAESAAIKLDIYDIAGRLVEKLADTKFPAGEKAIVWDTENKSSGVYFARLSSSSGNSARKLVLLR